VHRRASGGRGRRRGREEDFPLSAEPTQGWISPS